MNDDYAVIVTDLKQYAFCPRVVFYERCLPHIRPRTYKMDAGKVEHERERKRAARRTLHQFGLPAGERLFDVRCSNTLLQCSGIVDEVIQTPGGHQYPVDYKMAKRVSRNHRLQLAAYALLLETKDRPIPQGYIYLIPERELVSVQITSKLKHTTRELIYRMREMITAERMPEPTQIQQRCVACEFRRFCNDVD